MALFRFRWLRRMIRRHTNPIDEESAGKWERRLSFAYMLAASNAFIAVIYMVYTGRSDWATYYGYKSKEDAEVPIGLQWAQTLGIKNATVVKVSGFSKVGEYEIVDGNQVIAEEKNTPAPENTAKEE